MQVPLGRFSATYAEHISAYFAHTWAYVAHTSFKKKRKVPLGRFSRVFFQTLPRSVCRAYVSILRAYVTIRRAYVFFRTLLRSYRLIRPYICPHTAIYVSSYGYKYVLILLYVSSRYYICVRILLYMCPHTTVYVSTYYCTCVIILLCVLRLLYCLYMCPQTTLLSIYVSSDYSICLSDPLSQF